MRGAAWVRSYGSGCNTRYLRNYCIASKIALTCMQQTHLFMKKLYTLMAACCLSVLAYSQCMVQVICQPTTCNGNCDGSATAYSNGVPPFNYLWLPGGQTTQTISG